MELGSSNIQNQGVTPVGGLFRATVCSLHLSSHHRCFTIGVPFRNVETCNKATGAVLKQIKRYIYSKKPFDVYYRILHAYTIIYFNIGFFALETIRKH